MFVHYFMMYILYIIDYYYAMYNINYALVKFVCLLLLQIFFPVPTKFFVNPIPKKKKNPFVDRLHFALNRVSINNHI